MSRLFYEGYWHSRIRRQGQMGHQHLRSRRWVKESLWYVSVFLLFALCYVWTRVQVNETGYRIGRLSEETEVFKEVHHNLTVEMATWKSPQRLRRDAVRLGLVRPSEGQVIILGSRVARDLTRP